MIRIVFVITATLLVACQTPNPPTSIEPLEAAESTAKPAATVASPLSRDEAQQLVCADVKGPCTLTDLQPAGDAENRLQVAEVAFIETPDANGRWKFKDYDLPQECNTWALFKVDSQGPIFKELARFCNDGYGASGMGEDTWEVNKGRLSISTVGGSNWRWATLKVLDLPTHTIVQEGDYNYIATNPSSMHDQSRDYEKLTIFDSRSVWPCGAPEETIEVFQSLGIPRVVLPPAFAKDWKTTSLGACSTQLDATGDAAGFIIHGEKSAATDTSMKVVAHGNVIYAEVMDDQLVASASGNWIHGDHLELWVSTEPPPSMRVECVDLREKVKSWQWGIDALTGTVHEAYGKPAKKLVAEHVAIEGGVRFKITLPADTSAVTVIYSDSDDGKKQERLVATSNFKFAKVHTMGTLFDVGPEYLECGIEGGELVKSLKPFAGQIQPGM